MIMERFAVIEIHITILHIEGTTQLSRLVKGHQFAIFHFAFEIEGGGTVMLRFVVSRCSSIIFSCNFFLVSSFDDNFFGHTNIEQKTLKKYAEVQFHCSDIYSVI